MTASTSPHARLQPSAVSIIVRTSSRPAVAAFSDPVNESAMSTPKMISEMRLMGQHPLAFLLFLFIHTNRFPFNLNGNPSSQRSPRNAKNTDFQLLLCALCVLGGKLNFLSFCVAPGSLHAGRQQIERDGEGQIHRQDQHADEPSRAPAVGYE
jgi:hypothetical protein